MKVAVIHYWLINTRGGEKVIQTLLEMFPDSDIYTHVYDSKKIPVSFKSHKIFTSYIQKLPFARKLYQIYMPLMPNALTDFNIQNYDLIISSESGPAKGVIPNPNAYHICYCHSPMRYLWDMYHEYFQKSNLIVRFFMKRLIPGLRVWDIISSNYVDLFIANSSYIAKRIRRYYNREAKIVYPPVDIKKYLSIERKPKDFYLFFGQITKYKRVDLAIEACIALGKKLVIAGGGFKESEKQKYVKTGLISFLGHLSDSEIEELYSSAKALLFPGIEDFGIIPVEAQAAGCPVIAYREGGAVETIKENITGVFFDEQTSASLIEGIKHFEIEKEKGLFEDRSAFSEHVKQFSPETFKEKISGIITERKRL